MAETLIALTILAASVGAFARSYSYNLNATMHMEDQLRALHLANQVGRLVEQHALTAGSDAPDFNSAVAGFSEDLQTELNTQASSGEYRCQLVNGFVIPQESVSTEVSNGNTGGLTTIEQFMRQNNALCVTIRTDEVSMASSQLDNSRWVIVRVSWLSRGVQSLDVQHIETIRMAVHRDVKDVYTKYWY